MRNVIAILVCLCIFGCTGNQEDSPRLAYFNDVRWSWSPETTVFELDKRDYCTAYPDHTHSTQQQLFNASTEHLKAGDCSKIQKYLWNPLPFFSYAEWKTDPLLSKYQTLYRQVIETYSPAAGNKITRSMEDLRRLWSMYISSSNTLQKINRNIIIFDKVYAMPKTDAPVSKREFFYSPFYEHEWEKDDTLIAHVASIKSSAWPEVRAKLIASYGAGQNNTWINGDYYIVASVGSKIRLWNIHLQRLTDYLQNLASHKQIASQ